MKIVAVAEAADSNLLQTSVVAVVPTLRWRFVVVKIAAVAEAAGSNHPQSFVVMVAPTPR